MQAVELFAGAGGLALGVSRAGFRTSTVVERDGGACATLLHNRDRGFGALSSWDVRQSDVRDVNWDDIRGEIALLAGGPPCQPFSLGGKHGAFNDQRDMFPATASILRRLRPRAFIFENVKGLLRPRFSEYFDYILLQLRYPGLPLKPAEDWTAHYRRLERVRDSSTGADGAGYAVTATLVNAADYGVAQKRERVFIVGFRDDLRVNWSFPGPTHSAGALARSMWVTGEYWERHRVPKSRRPAVAQSNRGAAPTEALLPWRTVRDAIGDLPEPGSARARRVPNHTAQDGARIYPGHTGSPLDAPAKTIKAGAHGVPGGENMLVREDGSVRYFTVREAARIQTFPDDYHFPGSWSDSMRQLGNAVPVSLGAAVAASVRDALRLAR